MALSSIQWTDYTFNPWIGCRKVAPECANCYAETLDRNRYSKTLAPGTKENPVSHWGSGPRHRTKTWGDPLKWNKQAERAQRAWQNPPEGFTRTGERPHRPRVFCASLADWLDDENVPIEWLADLLKLIHDTPNLDWLLLTKRPQNWHARCTAAFDYMGDAKGWLESWLCYAGTGPMAGEYPANVWIGVSAGADQVAALAIPARIHFLSCEPMLRPLGTEYAARFDWIIFGGESGSKARPVQKRWFRNALQFCRINGPAPFVKQLGSNIEDVNDAGFDGEEGEWPMDTKFMELDSGYQGAPVRVLLKDSHGGDMEEWPEDLRVREFPQLANQ